jgi:hypothetical protein
MKGSKSKFMLLFYEKLFFNNVSPVGNSNFVISINIERRKEEGWRRKRKSKMRTNSLVASILSWKQLLNGPHLLNGA